MVIRREQLYDLIREKCKGEYAVGMHGISLGHLERYNRENKSVDEIVEDIYKDGIKVYEGRTIHGTVEFFGRIDDKSAESVVRNGTENYLYGDGSQIIVVIPTVFRSSEGEQLFLGTPNIRSEYSRYMGTQGDQETTLLDLVALRNDMVPSEFIFGSFNKNADGTIELNLNPNHISNRGGIVDSEVFDAAKKQVAYTGLSKFLSKNKSEVNIDEVIELYNYFRTKLENETDDYFRNKYAIYLETLKQYINEPSSKELDEMLFDGNDIYTDIQDGKRY